MLLDQRQEDLLRQIKLVGVVTVEGGAVDHGALGQLLHGHGLEAAFEQQIDEGLAQHFLRAAHAQVGLCATFWILCCKRNVALILWVDEERG